MPKWLFSLLIFIPHCILQAQSPPKRFAFQAGINTSNMDFNKGVPAPATHEEASWKTGITAGLSLRIPLSKNLFLQPEYAFTQRRGADGSLGINYTLDYFSMPVLLNYHISPRFAFLAGPQAEILIKAGSTIHGEHTNITHDVEERSIGILAGIEVQLIKNLFVSARYLQGLNHIGIGQRSNPKEFKYEAISLMAGISF